LEALQLLRLEGECSDRLLQLHQADYSEVLQLLHLVEDCLEVIQLLHPKEEDYSGVPKHPPQLVDFLEVHQRLHLLEDYLGQPHLLLQQVVCLEVHPQLQHR
jgi:hypothetical protein